jgi:Putative DNA-binding domain
MSRSTTLAQQQSDLLVAIFTTNNIAAKAINTLARGTKTPQIRGLRTYQANATASAQRSLKAAYPVISQLIGEDAFTHLAHDLWAQYPPICGDLGQWGDTLAGFIAGISALEGEPYLSDVAKTEWALHKASIAADLTTDFASFSLLAERDPSTLSLQLAPGTVLIRSEFPVASIMTAHLYAAPSLEEVGQKLRQAMPENALVSRNGLRPTVSSCMLKEANFISQILAGKSLLSALENATETDSDSDSDLQDFDFRSWLPQAVQTGLLLGAYMI